MLASVLIFLGAVLAKRNLALGTKIAARVLTETRTTHIFGATDDLHARLGRVREHETALPFVALPARIVEVRCCSPSSVVAWYTVMFDIERQTEVPRERLLRSRLTLSRLQLL